MDKLEVLADANYYEAEEIKKCVGNGIIPIFLKKMHMVKKI